MSNVNWCLMAVSFGLGLLLTLAFLIRRVKREVPVYGSGGGSAGLTGSAGLKVPKVSAPDVDVDAELPTAKVPKVDAPDVELPDVSGKGALAAAAAGVAGGAAAAKLVGSSGASAADEPYGAGSVRLAAGAAAPSGWLIKGNEDSMLFHTPDSPSYKQTIAEIWFRDEATARKAGFTHWKEGRSSGGATGMATFAATAAEVPPGPHGEGSATPGADGSGPTGWDIKGNEDSMLYHTLDSPSYKRTKAEVWFRDEAAALKAGFTHWKEGRKTSGAAKFAATEPELPPGPHGPGSATPNADGSGPAGWAVKGNEDSMLYHSTESPAYAVTVAEVWFRDVETAEQAGFNRWDSGKSQRGLD